MDTFVEQLPLSRVEAGNAGEEAQYMLKFWRRQNGFMARDSGMNQVSKKLMLFRPELIREDVPPATLIGRDTTFRKYFPFREQPTELPLSYRQWIAHGYHAAIAGEPWYDIQRTGSMMGDDTPDLVLERLILQFKTAGGFDRLFCLMMLREELPGSGRLDPGHRHGRSRQGIGHCQSGWVHRAPIVPPVHGAC